MDADLARVLAQVPELTGADVSATPIDGGMTNRNFHVRTPSGDYVVRMSAPQAGELGIDRDNEHRNSQLAAEVGVGAPVIARVREPEALVVGFVEGVTMSPADFAEPRPGLGARRRAAPAPRREAVRAGLQHGRCPSAVSADRDQERVSAAR